MSSRNSYIISELFIFTRLPITTAASRSEVRVYVCLQLHIVPCLPLIPLTKKTLDFERMAIDPYSDSIKLIPRVS